MQPRELRAHGAGDTFLSVTRKPRASGRGLRALLLGFVAFLQATAFVSSIALAGTPYFYCRMMEEVQAHCCCAAADRSDPPHDESASWTSTAPRCCDARVHPSVPPAAGASKTRVSSSPPFLVATLPAWPKRFLSVGFKVSRPRFQQLPRPPPKPARERRSLLMVSLV